MNLTTATEKPKRQNAAFKHLMVLHWVMAAFTLSLYVTGVFVAHPNVVSLLKWLSPLLHQSLGILSLMLLVARIFLLLRVMGQKYARRSPKVTFNWLQTTMLHSSLYFFMLIVPVSGFLLRNFIGVDTAFFGIHVPPVFVANKNWIDLARSSHFWSAYIFLAFIVLHILKHWKFVQKNVGKYLSTDQILFPKQKPDLSADLKPFDQRSIHKH